MLVHMAMCESLCSISLLPSPRSKKKPTLTYQCPLNSYITHPTGAGPRGCLAHIHAPLASYGSNTIQWDPEVTCL